MAGCTLPSSIDRSRGDRMLACGGLLPVDRPDLPGELGVLAAVDRRWHPGSAVDLHLNSLDGGAPGGPHDVVLPILPGDFGGYGLEERPAYQTSPSTLFARGAALPGWSHSRGP